MFVADCDEVLQNVEWANVGGDFDISELFARVTGTVTRHVDAFFFSELIRFALIDGDVGFVGAEFDLAEGEDRFVVPCFGEFAATEESPMA